MQASFNLIDQPWLPCVDADGQPRAVGILDALVEAPRLLELRGETPLATAALHRLLLAILHRCLGGPRSVRDWQRVWEVGSWDAQVLRGYCDQWHERFDLFDAENPFYQTPTLPREPEPVNRRLSLRRAYNSTLFDHDLHDGSIAIKPAQAAQWLIGLQAAGIGAGPPKHPYAQGPLVNSLLVLVQGRNLFETLMLNLLVYDPQRNKPIPPPKNGEDRPLWELDAYAYPAEPKTFYFPGYLGYLTWPVRRVHLIPERQNGELRVRECAIAQGPRWNQDIQDPMKVYHTTRSKTAGMLPIRLSEDRAMWRDAGALFRLADANASPPQAFELLASVVDTTPGLDRAQTYNYVALGLCNSNARLDFFRHERMPLPLSYLTDDNADLRENLMDALRVAEAVADALRYAGRDFARWYVSPDDKKAANRDDVKVVFEQLQIENRYWPALETPFTRFVTDLPQEGLVALDLWLDTVKRTARRAYEGATSRMSDPRRGLKALTLARSTLEYRMAKALEPKD